MDFFVLFLDVAPGTGRDGAINGQCPHKSYRSRTYNNNKQAQNGGQHRKKQRFRSQT